MEREANGGRNECGIARENVRAGVDPGRRFPRNVFRGDWGEFLFFDSDWMTDSDFVARLKLFLEVDVGHCACLWKLDAETPDAPREFFVRDETTVREYREILAGKVRGDGWLDAMERLACASDSGEWCMYCEPNNEIAVIAFRHAGASSRYFEAISQFRAAPIDLAIEQPLSYGFAQLSAAPEWQELLLREYGAKPV